MYPNNERVGKSDKLKAQETRCRLWLKHQGIEEYWVYRDEGCIKDPHLLLGLNALMRAVIYDNENAMIIADHPMRFGIKREARDKVFNILDELDIQRRFIFN